ncbi:MAG: hypothetical protein PHR28_00600 [candidate division Zixibacteria bacterium]|nr:hypothetical protein [candidate division Zixibacteria bacterium]
MANHFDKRRALKETITAVATSAALLFSLSVSIQGSDSKSRSVYSSPYYRQSADSPADAPNFQYDFHNVGQLGLAISNDGVIGFGPYWPGGNGIICEYPIGSRVQYMRGGALVVGGIVSQDTLLSNPMYVEFAPPAGAAGDFIRRSTLRSNAYYSPDAQSEQDFIAIYTDTSLFHNHIGPYDNRGHIPLGVSIRQSSYAWSYSYASDFILFDYHITNIGQDTISKMFIGIRIYGEPFTYGYDATYWSGLCGFRRTAPAQDRTCLAEDSINVAWVADVDGNANSEGEWDNRSARAVIGLRFLGANPKNRVFNYNWWADKAQKKPGGELSPNSEDSWGPRKAGTEEDPYRKFIIGMGEPYGDRETYYLLSHPEFDYDQLFCGFDHSGEGFMPPPPEAYKYVQWGWTEYAISFGPYDLAPGDSVSFAMALVAGENFHVNPSDFKEIFGDYNPTAYFATLNFDDLDRNARWAEYVYDNPGVDTDHDGYAGEYCWSYTWRDTTPDIPGDSVIVDSHKVYYSGDSIPDFRTVAPPPAPILRTFPSFGQIIVRWNGRDSETAVDFLTQDKSFEGYRVYMGKEDRLTDFVLLSSFDIEDYIIWQYSDLLGDWVKQGLPVTGDSLKILYGPDFDPTQYDNQYHAFTDPITGAYRFFAPQDWNQSDLSDPLKIHKLYPDASRDNPDDTTEEGYMRYYEYEYVIDNLQPSEPCYLSVTAFSRGSLDENVGVLETSPLINVVRDFPLPSSTMVEKEGLPVIVYPNPYRSDGGYARDGYENRDRLRRVEWSREIHFGNLPAVCKIRIYTLSGDLVQEIDHYYPNGGPGSQEETWNMISRNTQSITSGIYIWSVHSDKTDQLGKLVIIK